MLIEICNITILFLFMKLFLNEGEEFQSNVTMIFLSNFFFKQHRSCDLIHLFFSQLILMEGTSRAPTLPIEMGIFMIGDELHPVVETKTLISYEI